MADSFSPLLGLRLQQTGNNTNTWGDLLSSDTITPLEKAIAGRDDRNVSGGTLDLSASPLVGQVQQFYGNLTSDLTVIIPNLIKRMLIHNNTSGNFVMLVKTASSAAVSIPQGTLKDAYCDGVNTIYRVDRANVGEIIHFGRTTVPAGYLLCDGSAISRTLYPDLFAAIGTTHGAGNGSTTFNLPNLYGSGRFIRSSSASVAVGTLQAQDVQPHNHTASASTTITSISIAADGAWTPTISISDPQHIHTVSTSSDGGTPIVEYAMVPGAAGPLRVLNYNLGTAAAFRAAAASTGISASSSGIGNHTHAGSTGTATSTVTVNNSTGTETRPINISLLAVIRY